MIAAVPAYAIFKNAAHRGVFLTRNCLTLLFFAALVLSGCGGTQKDRTRLQILDDGLCQQAHTPVSTIQGNNLSSPLVGSQHTVLALVSHIDPSAGFFVEQPLSDGDPSTSDGLWVESASLTERVNIGDQVLVTGTVTELGDQQHSLTSLTAITGYTRCAENQPLPLHETGLPLDAVQREAHEGMRLQMQQNFMVTSVRDALTRGRISLSLSNRLTAPTEIYAPGEEAATMGRRNADRRIVLQWTDYADASLLDANPDGILVHDGVFQFSGVLSDTWGQHIVLTESFGWIPGIRNLPAPLPRQGNLRIASLNVENYFNGDGAGGEFPTRRGAKSVEEFERQRNRLVSTVQGLDADVLGLMEMENDGFGSQSAIQDLSGTLNGLDPDADWRVADPQRERVGTDDITVGILYKNSRVRAQGPANTLENGTFARSSRPPVAQRFLHGASGQGFMVVVNHFKSKGSCPESGPDANQGDGQACWNPTRVQSARELDQWLNSLTNILGEQRVVVLGDFNAQRMEDPVRAMIESGWKDLVAQFPGKLQHTYNYRGEVGTLDYIFASDAMNADTVDARVWPINADYPIGGIKDGPEYIRSSDHNPVLADFELPAD